MNLLVIGALGWAVDTAEVVHVTDVTVRPVHDLCQACLLYVKFEGARKETNNSGGAACGILEGRVEEGKGVEIENRRQTTKTVKKSTKLKSTHASTERCVQPWSCGGSITVNVCHRGAKHLTLITPVA